MSCFFFLPTPETTRSYSGDGSCFNPERVAIISRVSSFGDCDEFGCLPYRMTAPEGMFEVSADRNPATRNVNTWDRL